MNEILNPYIAGAPVVETSMFFGREDVFNWIERSLAGKYVDHILVLHGQRRVGKTSVLKQIPNFLSDKYIQVFFDLQGRTNTTLDRFLWWLAREIARALKQERAISIPRPSRDDFAADPEYLINEFLPSLRPHLNDQVLLLTFDEFDTLDRDEIQETFSKPLIIYLRRLMELDGLNFIFSIGSAGDKLENMQASYTDFFKSALYRKISFLTRDDSRSLITKPVEGTIQYDRKAVDRIHEITSGHPYFTQLMCHELFALCQKTNARSISKDDVESILDDVIERGTVNLKFVWDEANDLEKWILAGLAQLDGAATTQKLSQLLQKQRVRFSEPDLNSAILHLRDKDVITQENQLIIHLMRLWLHANRPLDRVREELAEVNPIANRYIEIGDEYRDLGQNQQAIESYQQALEVHSGNLKAQSSIGTVHLKASSFKQAVEAFELALQIDDENVLSRTGFCDANLALGDQARADDEIDEAIGNFKKILVINPAHADARQRLASIYSTWAEERLAASEDDAALSNFNQAIDFTPEDDQLIARYEEVLAQKKAKVVAGWLSKSERALNRQRWDDAADAVEEALKLDPENAGLQAKLAEVKDAPRQSKIQVYKDEAEKAIRRGNFEKAIAAIETAVQLAPEDSSLAEWLESTRTDQINTRLNVFRDQAQKAIAAGDWDEAIAARKAALKVSPNDRAVQQEYADTETAKLQAQLDILRSQAEQAIQVEEWDAAIKAYKSAHKLASDDPAWKEKIETTKAAKFQAQLDAFQKQADEAVAQSDWEAAIQAIRGAIKTAPDDTSWVEKRAEIEAARHKAQLQDLRTEAESARDAKQWDTAITALEGLLKLEPGDGEIQTEIETLRVEKRQSQLVKFKSKAEKAIQGEKWDQAVNAWENYLTLEPDDQTQAESTLQHARKYAQISGNYIEAQQAIRVKRYGRAIQLLQGIIAQEPTYKSTSRLLVEAVEANKAIPIWRRRWVIPALGAVIVAILGIIIGPQVSEIISSAQQPDPSPAWAEVILEYINDNPPDFEDDFSTVKDDWSHVLFDNETADQNLEDYIKDGAFIANRTGTESWGEINLGDLLGNTPLIGQDFALQFDVTPTELGERAVFVLYYRSANPGGHFAFSLNGNGAWSVGFEGLDHEAEEIIGGQTELFRLGESNKFQILALGDEGAIYLNGSLLTNFQYGQESFGQYINFGFGSDLETFEGSIDNIKFWNLDEPIPDEEITTPIEKPQIIVESIGDFIASQPPTFEDDFTTQKSNWVLPSGADIDSGVLIMNVENDEDLRVGGDHLTASDFVIEYDFLIEGDDGTSMAFEVRIDEFLFELYDDWIISIGNTSLHGRPNNYVPTIWNRLVIFIQGDRFEFYLNGELLTAFNEDISGEDNALHADAPGQGKVSIDNLRFWNLDGVNLVVPEAPRAPTPESTPAFYEPIQSYIESETPNFEDDFSAADSVWRRTSEGISIIGLVADGALTIMDHAEDTTLIADYAVPGVTFPTHGLLSANDFVLEFDFKFESLNNVGIVFRSSSPEPIIYKLNFSSAGAWTITENNDATLIAEGLIWQEDKFNTVLLIVLNQNIAIFFDDDLIYTANDLSPSGTFNGFTVTGSHGSEGKFDNVKFWDLDGVDLGAYGANPTTALFDAIAKTTPTYEDDFSTFNTEWWGGAEVEEGVLVINMGATESFSIPDGNFNASDFALQYDFEVLKSDGLLRNFGVGFRSSENRESYYEFKTAVNDGFSTLVRHGEPSGGVEIPMWFQSAIKNNVPYQVRILVIGNQIWILLDDELLFSTEDDKLSGETNFFWFEGEMIVHIDNLKFWNLDGVELNP